ncbi:MAG: hypothetical protein U9P73_06130 [Candidatus Cloacimonadota bacterium]|nr:hypothetical protein [Candidatus Cloacimonadota bacterium]
MSKKTILIILIVSLAFNFAFFGTFLFHRVNFGPGIHGPIHGRPKLPIHCREDFRELRKKMGEKHRDYFVARRQFILSLLEKDLNEEQVLKRLENAIEKQMIKEKEIGLSFIKLRKEMTAEEARLFFRRDLEAKEDKQKPRRGERK